MSRPVSVTPQAPQALRGNEIEKQLLWGRGQRLQFVVKRASFPILGVRISGGQGTQRGTGFEG